ncbi:MAG: serine/threonine protein kinase [Candidatus Xenobia bacterium]
MGTEGRLVTPNPSQFKPIGFFKRGRFSVVSLVLEKSTRQERLARLIIQPHRTTEIALLEGIDRVAQALRSLSHPSVPRFDRLVEGEGGTWMFFHYISGVPLSTYILKEAAVSEAWVTWWLYHVLQTLNYLHSQPVPFVIGHLEPSDVLVNGDALSICDLGIAEDIYPEVAASARPALRYVNFIAPEQRHAISIRPASDLFSAGALAFWLLTGHAPMITGPHSSGEHLAALTGVRPQLPLPVAELISRLLSFYPTLRPASAAEAADALRPHLQDMTGQTPPREKTSAFNLMAEETRAITEEPEAEEPPAPIFQAPAPAAPAALRTTAWQELVEDLQWHVRTHRRQMAQRGAVAMVVLLLGAGIWLLPAATRHTPPPTQAVIRPVLTVASGQVHARVPGFPVLTSIMPGATFASGDNGATLQFDATVLFLDARTDVTCADGDAHHATLAVWSGHVRTVTGPDNTVVLRLAGGVVTVSPNSELETSLAGSPPHATIACTGGQAQFVTANAGPRALSAGTTLTLP